MSARANWWENGDGRQLAGRGAPALPAQTPALHWLLRPDPIVPSQTWSSCGEVDPDDRQSPGCPPHVWCCLCALGCFVLAVWFGIFVLNHLAHRRRTLSNAVAGIAPRSTTTRGSLEAGEPSGAQSLYYLTQPPSSRWYAVVADGRHNRGGLSFDDVPSGDDDRPHSPGHSNDSDLPYEGGFPQSPEYEVPGQDPDGVDRDGNVAGLQTHELALHVAKRTCVRVLLWVPQGPSLRPF